MPTPVEIGRRVENIDMLELLPPDEGEIDQIYGRIGSGKTYCATKDIIKDLNRGQIWYTNWKINWNGYDQREKLLFIILGILGLKRKYYYFPKENLHYVDLLNLDNVIQDGKQTGKNFIEWLGQLTDCKIAFDEGHIQFNSYEKTRVNMKKLDTIYTARHFNKTYLIVSQRPTAVHVAARANVNRFFKCEKILDIKIFKRRILKFRKTEFQDTSENDIPNEIRVRDPKTGEETEEYKFAVSQRTYWGNKKIFKSYDSKYRRQNAPTSQINYAQLMNLTWKDTWTTLRNKIKIKRSN